MMFGKLRPGAKYQTFFWMLHFLELLSQKEKTLLILHQYFFNAMSILDLKWLQYKNLKGKKAPAPSVGAHI